jgi:hypothetical protein
VNARAAKKFIATHHLPHQFPSRLDAGDALLRKGEPTMIKLTLGVTIAMLGVLVGFSVSVLARRPPEGSHLVSMAESAGALQQAGLTMQSHGSVMLGEAQRTNNQTLAEQGQHWLADGQGLVQRARWLTMQPLAPSDLVTSPAELSAQGSWGELPQTANAMLHELAATRSIDPEALRWTGLGMRSEGQAMMEHGRLMAEAAKQVIAQHGLQGEDVTELPRAADSMLEVGEHLSKNGGAMLDEAGRLRRSLGYP